VDENLLENIALFCLTFRASGAPRAEKPAPMKKAAEAA
jgi:hypothetical protein